MITEKSGSNFELMKKTFPPPPSKKSLIIAPDDHGVSLQNKGEWG